MQPSPMGNTLSELEPSLRLALVIGVMDFLAFADANTCRISDPGSSSDAMRGNALLTASLLLCGSSAGAASFHCGKASSAMEKTICADPALSKADDAGALHRAWQSCLVPPDARCSPTRTASFAWR